MCSIKFTLAIAAIMIVHAAGMNVPHPGSKPDDCAPGQKHPVPNMPRTYGNAYPSHPGMMPGAPIIPIVPGGAASTATPTTESGSSTTESSTTESGSTESGSTVSGATESTDNGTTDGSNSTTPSGSTAQVTTTTPAGIPTIPTSGPARPARPAGGRVQRSPDMDSLQLTLQSYIAQLRDVAEMVQHQLSMVLNNMTIALTNRNITENLANGMDLIDPLSLWHKDGHVQLPGMAPQAQGEPAKPAQPNEPQAKQPALPANVQN